MKLSNDDLGYLLLVLNYIAISLDHRFTEDHLSALEDIRERIEWEYVDGDT